MTLKEDTKSSGMLKLTAMGWPVLLTMQRKSSVVLCVASNSCKHYANSYIPHALLLVVFTIGLATVVVLPFLL